MANPLVPQGTLNRLRASISFVSFPGLQITASFLGKEGIALAFDGVVTTPLDTMTGVVQSPEPYQRVTVSAHLIKSQALANNFKSQIELNSLVGDFVVRTDAGSMGPYQVSNGAINTVNPLKFDGSDAGWTLMLSGIYYVNASLWNF